MSSCFPAIIAYVQPITKPDHFISQNAFWSHCLFSISGTADIEQTYNSFSLKCLHAPLASHPGCRELNAHQSILQITSLCPS